VSNVGIEPPLQPLTGRHLTLGSANREDGALPDIAADNFWGRDQEPSIFDIRVFTPLAPYRCSIGSCNRLWYRLGEGQMSL